MSDFPRATRRRFLISLAAVSVRGVRARDVSPIVHISSGALRGSRSVGAWVFRGIPYGAPTGGEARFLAPRPPRPWGGIRDASSFGPAAPQAAVNGERQSEECLVLNIYTAALGNRGGRPVMVWLHGGGYGSGSGGSRFDGSRLASDHDVVFVAINHRLNVLGFLDLSAYDERYADSGNVGMLDVVAALRWVRENIERFGGDASRITIAGQSGGGAKVSTLLAMPSAAGLFERAIAMSGAVLTALTRGEARELTDALLGRLGITRGAIRKLRSIPPRILIDAMVAIGSTATPSSTRLNFGPVVDGVTLPHQPCDPDAPAISSGIPLLVGSTHDETRVFYASEPGFAAMTDALLRARLSTTMKTDRATVDQVLSAFRKALPTALPAELFLAITTQYMFTRNSVDMAARKARQDRAAVWLYRFDWVSPGPIGSRLRAAHAVDVPLALDLPGWNLSDDGPARLRMTRLMSQVWSEFARTGDPNGAGLSSWPAYDERRRATMLLDSECRVIDDAATPMPGTWASLPPFHP